MGSNEFKTIVNIPGWVDMFGNGEKLSGGIGAYAKIPLVYRCTRLISDSLASVDLKVYKGKGKQKQEVEWPFEIDTFDWTWRTVSSILLLGASYSVGQRNILGMDIGLEWIDPTTVTPELDRESREIYFRRNDGVVGGKTAWGADEMVYIREVNFGDGVKPGPSAVSVAMGDANLTNFMTKFVSYYFEQGAMPLTILPIPANTSDSEVKRVEKMFKSMASGIRRAWSIMALRAGKDSGQPFTLTPPLKDLAMPQLDTKVRKAIADAFGIPITMLDDAANYATASEHNSQFWKTCIRPHGKRIASVLNKYLKRYGIYAEYAFEELDEFQEDEANRADSVVKLTDAGMPLLVALDVLGYDLTKDQIEAIAAEVERRRKVQEQIAQAEAGGGSTPALQNDAAQASSPTGGAAQANSPIGTSNGDGKNPPSTPLQEGGQIRSALYHWKRAALVSIKTGHGVNIDFDHPAIPEEMAELIRVELGSCKSTDDVHIVFKRAREWIKEENPLNPPSGLRTRGADGEMLAELKRANDLLERELA
jgi:HK97 family phage portal protein